MKRRASSLTAAHELSSAQLLLAPVGAGKTEAALDRLVDAARRQPFAPIWVLVATDRQIDAFRRRLLERMGQSVQQRRSIFNIHFFNFYRLYSHLLHVAGKPQRCLDETARLRLLRVVLADLTRDGQLPLHGGIATTAGFVRVVAGFIDELKQGVIHPGDFALAANSDKDGELALIYAAYQAALQTNNLVDREGEGWLALDAARDNPTLAASVPLLLVDGYDQFNPLQAQLLVRLSGQAGETLITLTTVPGREQTIGRRFEQAAQRLQMVARELEYPLPVRLHEHPPADRQPTLGHLGSHIFLPDTPPRPVDAGLEFIEAPDVHYEVRAVLRRVKSLLMNGTPGDDILIAVRDWPLYANAFAAVAHEYGLTNALALQYSEPLDENPAIIALLDVLDLHLTGFRRRNLLDVLRSPYFEVRGLEDEWVELLDRVSRALRVTAGRDHWLEAVRIATQTRLDPEDEESETVLTAEAAEHLAYWLDKLFTRVTPPESASVTAYVRWLEMLIGDDPERDPDDEDDMVSPDVSTLNLIARLRRPAPQGIVERDLGALAKLKEILRGFLAVQQLLESLGAEEMVPWTSFVADLRAAIAGAVVERAPGRDGRVLVTTVTDARGLPHRHVFVPGLSEGVFPAQLPEDPLYLDSERRALADAGVALQTRADRADDDGLFFELISLARESLTLSRAYVKDGAPWPASHLWRAAARLFTNADAMTERVPVGAVVPPSEVACLHEAALSVADQLNRAALDADGGRLYNWLLEEHGDYWTAIELGRAIEAGRLSARRPFDRYSGRLRHPALIAQVEKALGRTKLWSATQLNELGICGFRYYAGRLLNLETVEEPDDGMTVLQAGSLYHQILEQTYRQIQVHGMAIEPSNRDEAVSMLKMIAAPILREAPRRLGFQASALWEQEKDVLLRRLETLVRQDFAERSPLWRYGSPRVPYLVEGVFGGAPDNAFTINLGEFTGPIRVRGVIDRIDRVGDRAVVIDYKSGSTPITSKELASGRNVQMLVYLLAADSLLARDPDGPTTISAGVFWHIGSGDLVGELRGDEHAEAMDSALAFLDQAIARGRQGDFMALANKIEDGKCARYCEFHKLCRVAVVNQRKPQGSRVDELNP